MALLAGDKYSLTTLLVHSASPIHALQEEQRAEKQAAKAAAVQLSVKDKSTFASRQQALFTDDTIKAAFHETLKASKKVSVSWAGFSRAAETAAGLALGLQLKEDCKQLRWVELAQLHYVQAEGTISCWPALAQFSLQNNSLTVL